jgi:hypothetical protein
MLVEERRRFFVDEDRSVGTGTFNVDVVAHIDTAIRLQNSDALPRKHAFASTHKPDRKSARLAPRCRMDGFWECMWTRVALMQEGVERVVPCHGFTDPFVDNPSHIRAGLGSLRNYLAKGYPLRSTIPGADR